MQYHLVVVVWQYFVSHIVKYVVQERRGWVELIKCFPCAYKPSVFC